MATNDNKREILTKVLGKVKLHDAGVKRKKMSECGPVMSESKINYPSLYLNAKQAPELKGSDVHDDITLVIKGKITSHSINEGVGMDSRETFDIQINKIGIIKK